MINLKIDPEFQNQIPPLTDDEYKQLEENILKEGKPQVWHRSITARLSGWTTSRNRALCPACRWASTR